MCLEGAYYDEKQDKCNKCGLVVTNCASCTLEFDEISCISCNTGFSLSINLYFKLIKYKPIKMTLDLVSNAKRKVLNVHLAFFLMENLGLLNNIL